MKHRRQTKFLNFSLSLSCPSRVSLSSRPDENAAAAAFFLHAFCPYFLVIIVYVRSCLLSGMGMMGKKTRYQPWGTSLCVDGFFANFFCLLSYHRHLTRCHALHLHREPHAARVLLQGRVIQPHAFRGKRARPGQGLPVLHTCRASRRIPLRRRCALRRLAGGSQESCAPAATRQRAPSASHPCRGQRTQHRCPLLPTRASRRTERVDEDRRGEGRGEGRCEVEGLFCVAFFDPAHKESAIVIAFGRQEMDHGTAHARPLVGKGTRQSERSTQPSTFVGGEGRGEGCSDP